MSAASTPSTASAGKLSRWFIGLLMVAIMFFGLYIASRPEAGQNYTLGLIIAGASLFGVYLLIKRGFDRA